MYFKIEKDSSLGQKIAALMARVAAGNEQMKKIANELTGTDNARFYVVPYYLTGVFYAIEFINPPGKEYAIVKMKNVHGHFYRPSSLEFKRKTSEISKAWNSIHDKVKEDDLNALFGLQSGNAGTFTWFRRPGLYTFSTCYIVNIDARWWKTAKNPPADMEEILESEYLRMEELEVERKNRKAAAV